MKDISEVRPSSIRHVIGQRAVVEQVRVALDAAQQDGRKFDHALLVGPPGCGKTTVAQVIAAEMSNDLTEVLGQSLADPADLHATLLAATDRSVLFIDECHELDKALQTRLFLALDQRKIQLPGGRKGSTPVSVPLADFTLLLASTDEFGILAPLRDRMRLTLRFSFASEDDLAVVVGQRVRALGWQTDPGVLPGIASRARGTPRLALRLLQAAHRVCRADGRETITGSDLNRACDLEQIDTLGLDVTQQQYLVALVDGPTRLNVVASLLGLPARTVAEVVEPYLVRKALVTKDDQGRRVLTALGREHLAARQPTLS